MRNFHRCVGLGELTVSFQLPLIVCGDLEHDVMGVTDYQFIVILSKGAYVTYVKSDDALRAIQSVNNIMLDGRPVKSSLGTTKYCSHFMKNQPCPKPDCMYLHDFGKSTLRGNCFCARYKRSVFPCLWVNELTR